MTDKICKNCVFYRSVTEFEGWCYRYPEMVQKERHHWCGEFKAKNTPANYNVYENGLL